MLFMGSIRGIGVPIDDLIHLIKGKGMSEEKRGGRIENWAKTSVSKIIPEMEYEESVAREGWVRRPLGLKEKVTLSGPFLEKIPLIKGVGSSNKTLMKDP